MEALSALLAAAWMGLSLLVFVGDDGHVPPTQPPTTPPPSRHAAKR